MKTLKVGKDGDLEISNKLDADDEAEVSIAQHSWDGAIEFIGKEDAIEIIKHLTELFELNMAAESKSEKDGDWMAVDEPAITAPRVTTQPIPTHPKEIMLEAIHHAAQCAYLYATSCEIGDERIKAFGIYEKIRTATRR